MPSWQTNSPVFDIKEFQLAWRGAVGKGKLLWSDSFLHALVTVHALLGEASLNDYEQASVEVFVDDNNSKSASYDDNDVC
jgi:endo-1,4-beta-xylanase